MSDSAAANCSAGLSPYLVSHGDTFNFKKVLAIFREVFDSEREFFIDKILVRIHVIIVMNGWTGLAPCEVELSFPGSLTSTNGAPTSRDFVNNLEFHSFEYDYKTCNFYHNFFVNLLQKGVRRRSTTLRPCPEYS